MFRSDAQVAAADKAAREWPVTITHDGTDWQFVSLAPVGAWYFQQPNVFLHVQDTKYDGRVFDAVLSTPLRGSGGVIDHTTQTVRQGPGCDCASTTHRGAESRFHDGTKRWHAARHAVEALSKAEAALFRGIAVDERDEREVALLATYRPDETAKVAKARESVASSRRLLDAEIARDVKARGSQRFPVRTRRGHKVTVTR
jgi:hypothetical protein